MSSYLSFVLVKSVSIVRFGLAIMMIIGCFNPVYAARKKNATPKVVVAAAVKEPKRVVAAPRVADASAKRSKKTVVAALAQDESAQQLEAPVVASAVMDVPAAAVVVELKKDVAASALVVEPYAFNNNILLPILTSLNQLDLVASLQDGTLSYTDCLVVLQDRLPQANVSSYTSDSFSRRVGAWMPILTANDFFNPNNVVKACEIGSYQGRSASWIIQNLLANSASELHCIDAFGSNMEHSSQHGNNLLFNRFSHNVYLTNRSAQCFPHKGMSQDILTSMAAAYTNYFDFMYIDGSYRADDVFNDAVLSFPLVKSGGLIFFDNYKWSWNPDSSLLPQQGIDKFIELYKDQVKVVGVGSYMYLQKL